MQDDWTRQEALKAVRAKADQAYTLLAEARQIANSNGATVDALNLAEAMLYVGEVMEG